MQTDVAAGFRFYHLDRGYQRLGKKLGAIGATIEPFSDA
jgi:UDP-N-acetylglucosamine enolpyruvyl transferase